MVVIQLRQSVIAERNRKCPYFSALLCKFGQNIILLISLNVVCPMIISKEKKNVEPMLHYFVFLGCLKILHVSNALVVELYELCHCFRIPISCAVFCLIHDMTSQSHWKNL